MAGLRSIVLASILVLASARVRVRAGGEDGRSDEVVNGPTHRGVEAAIHLPLVDHVANAAGTDGAGLCVWASLQMAARWESIPELAGLFAEMRRRPGGGWPERVAKVLAELAPSVPYVQYEGTDPAILDAAIAGNRPVCVTYGYGKLYGSETIHHMVLLAHLDPNLAAIVDNNDAGKWTWMSRAEFLRRWVHPGGKGWAVVLLGPPPPPPPRN